MVRVPLGQTHQCTESSSRHGPHQVAQKLTSTTFAALPGHRDRLAVERSSIVRSGDLGRRVRRSGASHTAVGRGRTTAGGPGSAAGPVAARGVDRRRTAAGGPEESTTTSNTAGMASGHGNSFADPSGFIVAPQDGRLLGKAAVRACQAMRRHARRMATERRGRPWHGRIPIIDSPGRPAATSANPATRVQLDEERERRKAAQALDRGSGPAPASPSAAHWSGPPCS